MLSECTTREVSLIPVRTSDPRPKVGRCRVLLIRLIRQVEADADYIADVLLNEFSPLGCVLAAARERLTRVIPAHPNIVDHLVTTRAFILHALQSNIADRPLISSPFELMEYLHADMAPLQFERVRILHLNAQHALIRDEVASEGTIDHANTHMREIVRRALELGTATLIIVHNHPSGACQPSQADLMMTQRLANACGLMHLRLFDHLIIAGDAHYSFRAHGLL